MYFLICNGKVNPSGCHGSYAILEGRTLVGAEVLQRETLELPSTTTSYETEYHSLLQGLVALQRIALQDKYKKTIKVLMGSKFVIDQISGTDEIRYVDLNLRALRLLAGFRSWQISLLWIDQSIVEEYLGH